MQLIIGIILAIIVAYNMLPAIASNDPETVQRAAERTVEQVVKFTTDRIVDEVESLPLKALKDVVSENK